jgi:hypothetical protein
MRSRCLEYLASLSTMTLALAVLLVPASLAGHAVAVTMLDSSTQRASPRPPAPSTFVNLNFVVAAAGSRALIKGATVTIDYNSGNGTDRTTDGAGFCNFGVISPRTYRYKVTKSNFDPVAGEVSVAGNAVTVPVALVHLRRS